MSLSDSIIILIYFITKITKLFMRGLDSSSSSKSKGRQRDPNSKITIRVDKLLKKTYSGLVSGKIKNLIQ